MMFFFKLPQNRHPERSASQIDCVIQRLWRVVEGSRRCLFCPCCSELFDHRSPTTGSATPPIRLEHELKPGANALLPSSPIPKGGKTMQEENVALEAQYRSLRELVGELLLTNQRLRIELNRLQQQRPSTVDLPFDREA